MTSKRPTNQTDLNYSTRTDAGTFGSLDVAEVHMSSKYDMDVMNFAGEPHPLVTPQDFSYKND